MYFLSREIGIVVILGFIPQRDLRAIEKPQTSPKYLVIVPKRSAMDSVRPFDKLLLALSGKLGEERKDDVPHVVLIAVLPTARNSSVRTHEQC